MIGALSSSADPSATSAASDTPSRVSSRKYCRRVIPAIERFLEKIEKREGGCWEWIASRTEAGYGQFNWTGTGSAGLAHRFSYTYFVGPIPEGLQLDHLCRNRACVNPAHLEPVTNRENTLRGIVSQVHRERARMKTHCKRGHPFDEKNTRRYVEKDGKVSRNCRRCSSILGHEWKAMNRERVNEMQRRRRALGGL